MEFILIVLSSLLFTIPYYFPALFFLSWLAFIPLIYLIKDYDYSHSFIVALLVGILNSVFSLYWLYQPLSSVLKMPSSFNLFILFIYFIISALPLAVWVLLNKFLQPEYSYSPFIAALSWSVLEYLRFEFLNLNPFNYFAYTQSSFTFIAQYAAYGGIFLVSFISVLIASYLLKIFLEPNWKKAVPLLMIFIILAIIPLYSYPSSEANLNKQSVDLLINKSQENNNHFEKIEDEINDFAALIENKKSNYIFTAENNFSFDLIRNSFYRDNLFSKLENKLDNSYLQLGSLTAATANYDSEILNYLFLLSVNLKIINRSNKQMNFLSGVNFINKEKLINFFAAHLNFNYKMIKRPQKIEIIEAEKIKFINLISDEIFIPLVSRRNNYAVDLNLIVNAAAEEKINSGVYNNLALAAAVYRAAESNTTLVRAVSGGYSAYIDYRGKIISKEKLKNNIKTYNLTLYEGQSYYQKNPTKIINIFIIILLIIAFIKIMIILRNKFSSRH
jgi:apolipoprotein N-acyltransferase